MFCDSSDYPQKFLQIRQNDKFFSKLLTKESSRANPSSRVYYGGLAGAVPFVWESQPGTPKHRFSDDVTPPLTPPPSYYSNSNYRKPTKKQSKSPSLLHILFPNFSRKTKVDLWTPPFSKSKSFPASGSQSNSTVSARVTGAKCLSCGRAGRFSSGSSSSKEEEEAAGVRSPTSILCLGIGRVSGAGLKNLHRF